MSNLTFRPRPIDIYKPLQIIRHHIPEEECIGRSVPQMPTGMEAAEEEEHHIRIMISGESDTNMSMKIPTPGVRDVSEYLQQTMGRSFSYPANSFITTASQEEQERMGDLDQRVEYDMDDEDFDWLSQFNKTSNYPVTEDLFEHLVDRFEKAAFHSQNSFTVFQAQHLFDRDSVHPAVVGSVFEFWMQKRAKRKGDFLSRRFMKPPAWNAISPLVAFRPRKPESEGTRQAERERERKRKKRNDATAARRMRQLRQEFDGLRLLCEAVGRREKLKRDLVINSQRLFCRLFPGAGLGTFSHRKLHDDQGSLAFEEVDDMWDFGNKQNRMSFSTRDRSSSTFHSRLNRSMSFPYDTFDTRRAFRTFSELDLSDQEGSRYSFSGPSSSSGESSSSENESEASTPRSVTYLEWCNAVRENGNQVLWGWLGPRFSYCTSHSHPRKPVLTRSESLDIGRELPKYATSLRPRKLSDGRIVLPPPPSSSSFSPVRRPRPFCGRARIGRGGRLLFDRGGVSPPTSDFSSSDSEGEPAPNTVVLHSLHSGNIEACSSSTDAMQVDS